MLDPTRDDLVARCLKICADEGGVHVAYDTVGKQNSLDQALKALRAGGTLVNAAIWGGAASILPNAFVMSELVYMGTGVYNDDDFQQIIDALASGMLY